MAQPVLRVKVLFNELRRLTGDQATTTEILHFVAHAAEFFDRKHREKTPDDFDHPGEVEKSFQAFEELSIDVAMYDGGWKILEYESLATREDLYHFGQLEISESTVNYDFSFSLYSHERLLPEATDWIARSQRPNHIEKKLTNQFVFEKWEIDQHE